MTTAANKTRQSVMNVAWCLFREAAKAGEARTFADALKGAWRWVKKLAKAKAPAFARRSLIAPSAVARHYGAAAFTGGRSGHAYQASRMGA
ncbi:MAG: hypothetical protein Q8S03_18040 [Brevundimonas sp.]|uniref:hypothetical protein n=1 Tax=Brevundimonas sp. TaxID=1871086 RepID=UPI00273570C9|nr:hypothetical protein [Brevundimonas sp.]MDP3406595.1 hypothetical protein [Brevundimonas sp.]